MAAFEQAVRQEIKRLARREIKRQVTPLLTALRRQKHALVALKTALDALAQKRAEAGPALSAGAPIAAVTAADMKKARFSAFLVKRLRARLELSRELFGSLLGVSAISVMSWEQGSNRPREASQKAIVAVRKMSKRQVKQLLAAKRSVWQ